MSTTTTNPDVAVDAPEPCGICGSTGACARPNDQGQCPVDVNLSKIDE